MVLFTLALFAANILWQWLVSPLFDRMGTGLGIVLLQALVRTAFFAVAAVVVVSRMDISPEVNRIIGLILPKSLRKRD